MKCKLIATLATAVMLSCAACSGQNMITDKEDDRVFVQDQADQDTVARTAVQSEKGDTSNMSWMGNAARIPEEYFARASVRGTVESRDHRAFAGFSMGSVTTWHTFQYCLDYFRYFLPSSGNLTSDGRYMERLVTDSGHEADDFFIYAMSGTEDFAYAAFSHQLQAMLDAPGGIFTAADNENDGNLAYRVQEGNAHNDGAAVQYI